LPDEPTPTGSIKEMTFTPAVISTNLGAEIDRLRAVFLFVVPELTRSADIKLN
jgi:hypothetical protein